MLVKNKSSFVRIFFKTFISLSLIFLVGNISINALFYFFPSVFHILSSNYSAEIVYNELRKSKWSWDIESLESSLILGREADRTELIWDALYVRDWSQDAVLSYYERSLALRESTRVKMKIDQISLLSWSSLTSSWEKIRESTTGSGISSGSLSQIQNATLRTEESSENRWKYIQKPYDAYIIQDSRDFLELGIERQDW